MEKKLTNRERCEKLLEAYPGSFDLRKDMVYLKKVDKGVKYYDPYKLESPEMTVMLESTENMIKSRKL